MQKVTKYKWQVSLTVVFVVLGIFLSLQYQAQNRIANDLTYERTENLIAMVRSLSEKRQELAFEIYDLNSKMSTLIENKNDEKKLIADIEAEAKKYDIVTGITAVKGRGLTVTFEKSMPILYIDIINIINELWAAGAEAIAVNDQRVTGSSSIFYVEDESSMFITVNNHKLDFPVIISAIGDPNNLEKGLTLPGGIIDNLALFKTFPQLSKSDSLTLPKISALPNYYFLYEYKAPPEITTPTPAITEKTVP